MICRDNAGVKAYLKRFAGERGEFKTLLRLSKFWEFCFRVVGSTCLIRSWEAEVCTNIIPASQRSASYQDHDVLPGEQPAPLITLQLAKGQNHNHINSAASELHLWCANVECAKRATSTPRGGGAAREVASARAESKSKWRGSPKLQHNAKSCDKRLAMQIPFVNRSTMQMRERNKSLANSDGRTIIQEGDPAPLSRAFSKYNAHLHTCFSSIET